MNIVNVLYPTFLLRNVSDCFTITDLPEDIVFVNEDIVGKYKFIIKPKVTTFFKQLINKIIRNNSYTVIINTLVDYDNNRFDFIILTNTVVLQKLYISYDSNKYSRDLITITTNFLLQVYGIYK